MSRMIQLIRQSAVPVNIMRTAAKGALALPASEMLEILVHLTGNPAFAQQSRMTLAGWDETSSQAVVSDPKSPPAVLDYFSKPENLRLSLLPAVLENPSVPEDRLVEIAHSGSGDIITKMLESPRVQQCARVLQGLGSNQHLEVRETERVQELLARLGETLRPVQPDDTEPYEVKHASEIAAEKDRPFTMVTLTGDILGLGFEELPPAAEGAAIALEVLPALAARAKNGDSDPVVQKRLSTLHRIAKLTVGERVQLAMKGNRDERFILIRDGAKVVALAVLESPKLADNEAEVYASMRNVQELVLRGIAMKRKLMKNYGVVKALINNPRTPLEVALPLLNHLLLNDLRMLSTNKNVGDTIRKLAIKLFNQKKRGATGGR